MSDGHTRKSAKTSSLLESSFQAPTFSKEIRTSSVITFLHVVQPVGIPFLPEPVWVGLSYAWGSDRGSR